MGYTTFNDEHSSIRYAWWKATDEQKELYKIKCENNLKEIDINYSMLKCTDIKCTRHLSDIGKFYSSIIEACLDASDAHIPKSGADKAQESKTIPGWNDQVEQLRRDSLMWHHHWKESGQPHSGQIAEMRRMSRARYHHAVRKVIKNENLIRSEKMAEAIVDNRSRDLMREARKIKGNNNLKPGNIDGATGDEDISTLFKEKYSNLYNSVPFDRNEMKNICNEINDRITDENSVYTLSVSDIINAVERLKLGKNDGEEGLNSDHVINGPHLLYVMLTNVFNCMLVHGTCPQSLINGTMVPIVKCKRKPLSCSDNYRAITLSSILSKVFDWVVLLREHDTLISNDLQFGFKQH